MNHMVRRVLPLCAGLLACTAVNATEVVIISCQGPAPSSLVVTESSSSFGAPFVPPGTSCAQAVADLINAKLKLVASSSPGVGVIYTFVR